MKGAVLHAPRDLRYEELPAPAIVEPTDAVVRLSASCVCGSDLWPYRGVSATTAPTPMGHEYCGIVEEVGRSVTSVKQDGEPGEAGRSIAPDFKLDETRLGRSPRRVRAGAP